ncbi:MULTISPECIES: DUF4185 domain-containing protein [unclassified Gordonia (in: high G+C Gram-positive bacteria)]|uniref:DUF4185 domain-containing protein n=1 Tax=unclassified Gordonia (in: high G+C Gram-positive bacteria) TaxID=2657482 RepID=UPI001F0F666D|nr:DUF4185 domain-containing protein [Gordonia sp. ABSL49_1]MCH5641105.1 DUF4185 domain-containing protein [Gordonia sp. ABSL49_1]
MFRPGWLPRAADRRRPRLLRSALTGATVGALALTGVVVGTPTAEASICAATGFHGGDVGSTGSSGSSQLGMGSLDFGSYRADGKKPQGPLPRLKGPSRAIQWITGPRSPNRTDKRFSITSTDVGVMWDNGSGQILMAFGDTWGKCAGQMVWRHNTMLRSNPTADLDKGMSFPNAIPGSVRSGASVTPQHPTFAQPMLNAIGVRNTEVGKIPTGGISIGGVQYMNYMSIHKWTGPGRWETNFSAIAVSYNNGQTWTTNNNTIRANVELSIPGMPQVQAGHGRFQMGAFLRSGDYVYQYGTPNGRHGAAFIARVRPADILNLNRYEYFAGNGWSPNPAAAVPIIRQPVSETTVAYNNYLGKFVMLTERAGNIMLRTSPSPVGPWSGERLIVARSQTDGLYAPYIHPRSTGQMLYFAASRWDDYNVMMIRTDLSKIR